MADMTPKALWNGAAPALTVGELRKLLDGQDDGTYVVLADTDWYQHVKEVEVPDIEDPEYSDWQCVTLFPGQPLEPRDL